MGITNYPAVLAATAFIKKAIFDLGSSIFADVVVLLDASGNAIGAANPLPVTAQLTVTTTTRARVSSAASTNATSVKAAAGSLYHVTVVNLTAAWIYLKFYDKASVPVVGTDTPAFIIAVPPNGGFSEPFNVPVPFAAGIAYAITGGVTDADATAVAAAALTGLLLYA